MRCDAWVEVFIVRQGGPRLIKFIAVDKAILCECLHPEIGGHIHAVFQPESTVAREV